jgi:hypothetical protein
LYGSTRYRPFECGSENFLVIKDHAIESLVLSKDTCKLKSELSKNKRGDFILHFVTVKNRSPVYPWAATPSVVVVLVQL